MTDIEKLVVQGRFDRQLALVGEHWAAGRRLWLSDSDLDTGAKIRSELPPHFGFGAGLPGLADIKPTRGDLFDFTADGRRALIIPAYHVIPGDLDADPAAHVEHLVDLVAVDVDHPDRFWRRRGEALVLGNAYLEIAGDQGEPIPVYRNPLSWLRSSGAGVVVLDWDYARDLLLDHELIAEDLETGKRLRAALKPEIWIRAEAA